jgi:hypothetical protein
MEPLTDSGCTSVIGTNDAQFTKIIGDICALSWENIDRAELFSVMQVYYYFSIQFRQNLEIACNMFPEDEKLHTLYVAECNTDNLSPWPGISMNGENLDHDEFIRRALLLQPELRSRDLDELGMLYLSKIHSVDDLSRAKSIASYEDNGLSRVFLSILSSPDWRGSGLQAFKHFLEKHIEFDGDGEESHGLLSRHLLADDSVVPLWGAFHELMLSAAPRLALDGRSSVSAEARVAGRFASSAWVGRDQ